LPSGEKQSEDASPTTDRKEITLLIGCYTV
jgi:hypothetical protein